GVVLDVFHNKRNRGIADENIHSLPVSAKFVHQHGRVVRIPNISADDQRFWGSLVRESPIDVIFVRGAPLVRDCTSRAKLCKSQRRFQTDAHSATGHERGAAPKVADHVVETAFNFSWTDACSRSTRPFMFVNLLNSERGTFTLSSRIADDTTST